ncbi:nitroreductase/quinone reductase family protein [Allostreptomyces psammosilenae]|uniref:Deazaflavin-dependent oxidoreductase (Nitroreductase family) n=1 Tax=Allostreptomyces psammosilenae TaxID=1892865 RepID=A0A852ZTC1_9ACTN|nr:nitroreductase/quinone reductase family protein [Allostreptomyces psammosilenae]NYI04520.1 deazaflavin-dependent oxidoreductase (nitroreductase family) [Allostreptomyces psammosilenae]
MGRRVAALARRLGHRGWFAAVGRRLWRVDRLVQRVSRGRTMLVGRHGMHPLLLTTRGRRTGRERTVPLIYAEDGGGYLVVGSNWGRSDHPAWSGNLLACPRARVTVGGRVVDVRATLLTGAERARAWEVMAEQWPAYDTYATRSGRGIRVFRLTPDPPAAP